MTTVEALDERLSGPTPGVIQTLSELDGDLLVLGAGGKMGPTLARMAARALKTTGSRRKVIGVSSFSSPEIRSRLDQWGIMTIKADLLAPDALASLPDAENVIYMCGRKFGSTGAEWNTWATNVLLAGLAARRYSKARIVAFSSGNVYPFEPVLQGGSTENTPPGPVGEYAMSCLGRERFFDYYSHEFGLNVLHLRLNYAIELRYGILLDIASQVWNGRPIDLTMGHVNVVWQGYANAVALQCLRLAASPPGVLNVTGPETVSIRWLATRLGELMDRQPVFSCTEASSALLSNAARCHCLFGYPDVSLHTMVEWVAQWVMAGSETLNKPTHFQVRDGKF
ncbi:MAG: NAD(P)-dependent oxidoreductase [Candidatus Hydrogenedentes bacterium]|nr:NAD(P)-dependent oxidoreductase [Candidatus Hydrogenedentota bacterium]